KTSISGGDSKLEYYTVTVDLAYSYLTPEGKWAAVQKLPWLYPSEAETISAVPRVFSEDDLAEMLVSKLYLKVYPKIVGDRIVLRCFNRTLNQNSYFDRELDLFHNKLPGTSAVIAVPPTTALMMYEDGNSARLGIEKYNFSDYSYFDEVLEEPMAVATPHAYVTNAWAQKSYNSTDPRTDYYMHYVQ